VIGHQVGNQTVYEADCLELMDSLAEGSVDVICTSPPYNLGKDYTTYDDGVDWDSYTHSLALRLRAMARVLDEQGSLFFNYGYVPSASWKLVAMLQTLAGLDLTIQNMIVWVKSMALDEQTHGHYQPINSDRFLNHNWELVVHCTPTGSTPIQRLAPGVGVPYMDKANMGRWDTDNDVHCAGDVWFIPYKTVQSSTQDRYAHPSPFPVELPARCLRLHGLRPDLVVLDPFMGTGSTLLACQELGVCGTGVDIDPDYCAVAVKRLEEQG